MNTSEIKRNKLNMVLSFAIPSIVSMLLTTLITITDGYFTGNYVGEEALAAINLGLPIIYLFLGLGLCLGVGGSVIAGKYMGAKDGKNACSVFSQTIVSALIICIVTAIVVFALFAPILSILRAEGKLSIYFNQYYKIMLITYPIMVLSTIFGIFIRLDGKPQVCMVVSILSVSLNCILDYIFMVKFNMGVSGSAYASLIVQFIAVALQLIYFVKGFEVLHFVKYKFNRSWAKEMILNGSSEFIGEMASAVSMFSFNYVIMRYVGAEGVAAFTILGFAVYFYSMIAIGFGQGLTPLVSICQGAKEYRLSIELRKLTNKIVFIIGFIFTLLCLFFARKYALIFGCTIDTANMVIQGFYFVSPSFIIMGYDVISSMYFTSCGDAKSSAIISSLRGIVLLLIFTFTFPIFWGLKGILAVTPVTEVLTAIVTTTLLIKHKRVINNAA